MLRADAHQRVDAPRAAADRETKHVAVPSRRRVQAGEHGQRRRLAGAIVAEQAGDLPRVKGEVQVVDGNLAHLASAVNLRQADNLDRISPRRKGGRDRLEGGALLRESHLCARRLQGRAPKGAAQEEERVEGCAEARGEDTVEVEGEGRVQQRVEQQHPERESEGVGRVGPVLGAHADRRVLVLAEHVRAKGKGGGRRERGRDLGARLLEAVGACEEVLGQDEGEEGDRAGGGGEDGVGEAGGDEEGEGDAGEAEEGEVEQQDPEGRVRQEEGADESAEQRVCSELDERSHIPRSDMHAAPQAHDAHGLREARLLLLDHGLGEQRGGEELAEGEEEGQQRLDGEVERVLRVGGGGEGRQPRHVRGRREGLGAVAGGEAKRKAVDGALQREEAGGDVPLVLGVEASCTRCRGPA
mmetsp:Transcript_4042/g.12061  ORF Transcript_4042/g.12061 Transcript_4042/m.12061 type:complete len:413 (-) Transcript_4042:921-2159(-)